MSNFASVCCLIYPNCLQMELLSTQSSSLCSLRFRLHSLSLKHDNWRHRLTPFFLLVLFIAETLAQASLEVLAWLYIALLFKDGMFWHISIGKQVHAQLLYLQLAEHQATCCALLLMEHGYLNWHPSVTGNFLICFLMALLPSLFSLQLQVNAVEALSEETPTTV